MQNVVNLIDVDSSHLDVVGGKNASIGEMLKHLTSKGVNVPGGYAITVQAFENFLQHEGLDQEIKNLLATIDVDNITQLNHVSARIRKLILAAPFAPQFVDDIAEVLSKLNHCAVAVRSSARGEDLADASFAGQQESFLNVRGLTPVLSAIKVVYASPFNSRAIAYRHHHGFDHTAYALSVGIQPMIRSDKATSGVIFTMDTETGFDQVILISASYGLGEAIVQGKVNPDEFLVYKPMVEKRKLSILQRKLGNKVLKMIYAKTNSRKNTNPHASIKTVTVDPKAQKQFCLSDREIKTLAEYAIIIEKHYQRPMDIEWAKDGEDGKLYIVQARPETVNSCQQEKHTATLTQYRIKQKGKVITQGQSVGQKIGQGQACIIKDPKHIRNFTGNKVLVTDMTDPDWEPIMKKASAIVTNRGGRTCHAAIIARELGIPAVVGCGNATTTIKHNMPITVSCAEGQNGYIYEGRLPFETESVSIKDMPELPVQVCVNLGNPEMAFVSQFLPNKGVGLARIEFIISNHIGIHPNALINLDKLPKKLKQQILQQTSAYQNPVEFYIEKLREGIATIAAAFYPKQVIFRFSDFKTNEYANLLGGHLYEPREENPMLGYRGASRYTDKNFIGCFKLECEAIKRVHDDMGLTNAQVMVPFVRTVDELMRVIALMEKNGLKRGKNGLKIYMMCEVPSNVILAKSFLQYVDGFSIGSNDLTQLTLGLDRDSNLVAGLFDERNLAVKALLKKVIADCKAEKKYIGICGQGPSDYPDFAEWLMAQGIDAISINPDTVVSTWLALAKVCENQNFKRTEMLVSQAEDALSGAILTTDDPILVGD